MSSTIENGRITGTTLGDRDRGFSSFVKIEMDGSGCGFGGFQLGGEVTHLWVSRILEVTGAPTWEALKGLPVRVDTEGVGGSILRLGHFIEDKWFDPRAEFKDLLEAAK